MALGNTSATTAIGDIVYKQSSATGTADDDLSGSSTATIYGVELSSSAPETNYVKLWDNNNPTVGTDAPTLILPVSANSNQTVLIMGGVLFSNLSLACVQTGGVGGTTDPSGDVSVEIIVDLS